MDGKLIPQSRLLKLSIIELLNWSYSQMVDGLDPKQRKWVDAMLEGRLGPNGGILVDDPDLPESMQGQEAPLWWDADEDPLANSFTVPN